MSKWIGLVLATAVMMMVAGCVRYSFKGALPSNLKTIAIPLFEDKAQPPWIGLQEDMTRSVVDAFIDDNSLKVIEDEDAADLVLRGTILNVGKRTTSVSSDRVVAEQQLEVRVKVECMNVQADKPLWSSTLSDFGVISGSASLDEMDAAVDFAMEKIVEQIIDNTIAAW